MCIHTYLFLFTDQRASSTARVSTTVNVAKVCKYMQRLCLQAIPDPWVHRVVEGR